MGLTLRDIVQSLSEPVWEAAAWALLEESARVLTQKIQDQSQNMTPFISPDYVSLTKRGHLQFVFGHPEESEIEFAAPERNRNQPGSAQKDYVYSLAGLIFFALEYNGRNEVGAELAGLLKQMKSPNAPERPEIEVVLEHSQAWRKVRFPGSSANDELSKLIRLSHPDDPLVNSEDSESTLEPETLSVEIEVGERSARNQHHPQNGAKESQSLNEKFESLNQQESVSGTNSVTVDKESMLRQAQVKGKPLPTTCLSSREQGKCQSEAAGGLPATRQGERSQHASPDATAHSSSSQPQLDFKVDGCKIACEEGGTNRNNLLSIEGGLPDEPRSDDAVLVAATGSEGEACKDELPVVAPHFPSPHPQSPPTCKDLDYEEYSFGKPAMVGSHVSEEQRTVDSYGLQEEPREHQIEHFCDKESSITRRDMIQCAREEERDPSEWTGLSQLTTDKDKTLQLNQTLPPMKHSEEGSHSKAKSSSMAKSGALAQIAVGEREVNVKVFNGEQVQLWVHRNIQCDKLLEKLVSQQGITDRSKVLGLALLQDDEFIFLDPTKKVSHYAPKEWRRRKASLASDGTEAHDQVLVAPTQTQDSEPASSPKSVPDMSTCREPHLFTVHLRVMFFIPHVAELRDTETRNLHYAQVKQDLVNDRLYCSTTTAALTLAALAFQAEHSNQEGIHQSYSYAQMQPYLSNRIMEELKGVNIGADLSELHRKYKDLSGVQAQLKFFQEVTQKLNGYERVSYQASTMKQRQVPPDRLLAFSLNGISVYATGSFKLLLDCPWKKAEKISFHGRKFVLDVAGHGVRTFYATNYGRADYFLRLAKTYHKFNLKMRSSSEFAPRAEHRAAAAAATPDHDKVGRRTSKQDDSLLDDVYQVEINLSKRSKGKGFGFRALRRDTIVKGKKHGLYVESVVQHAGAEGSLREGDEILEVNDQSLVGLSHDRVVKKIRSLPNEAKFLVQRKKESPKHPSTIITQTSDSTGSGREEDREERRRMGSTSGEKTVSFGSWREDSFT